MSMVARDRESPKDNATTCYRKASRVLNTVPSMMERKVAFAETNDPAEYKLSVDDELSQTPVKQDLRRGSLAFIMGTSENCSSLPFRVLLNIRKTIVDLFTHNSEKLVMAAYLILLLIMHAFLGIALWHDFHKSLTMLLVYVVVWVFVISHYAKKLLWPRIVRSDRRWTKYDTCLPFRIFSWLFIVLAIVVFLLYDTRNERRRLTGLFGMAIFICVMFLFSTNPHKINWRPVAWGFLLQFCLGLIVLRWKWGAERFLDASNAIVKFIDFTQKGTVFVYGFVASPPNICGMTPSFAFTALQVIVFFGAIVAFLYYIGIMQVVLRNMAFLMQATMGTTAAESVNACACVFVGMAEAPLLIRPYLNKLTISEMHAVMTSGFSTIAGSLLAAYISFGACPTYLLSATVMSAPGSLACAKLLCPETEESQLSNVEDLELPPSEEGTVLECLSNGAVSAAHLVVAVIANLIVFVAILAFIDACIGYCGSQIGFENWSLETVLGYVLFPVAYVMGVNESVSETLHVAQLLGVKTMVNEFIAYQKLGTMVQQNLLSPRAQMIATYALCGFSNFGSLSIQLGILGTMVPERKAVFAKLALRALMAGSISCFFTACLASILVQSPILCLPLDATRNCINVASLVQQLAMLNATSILI